MGRPSRIDRGRVLAAALRLADEEGLDSLTMSRVARRLGVTPMALYKHVANKADLLDGLVELLLTELPHPAPDVAWDDRLVAFARNVRTSARHHPTVFPLLLQRSAATTEARRMREGIYGALVQAGVPRDRVAQAERLISTAVLGFAVSEVAGRFKNLSRRQLDADFTRLLAFLAQFIALESDSALDAIT